MDQYHIYLLNFVTFPSSFVSDKKLLIFWLDSQVEGEPSADLH